MKKSVKLIGSIMLIGSMLFSMAGCSLTDVKNTGDDILEMAFNGKKKVTKYLNEDDDDYDIQCEFMEEILEAMDEELSLDYEDTEFKSNKITVKNKDATIVYKVSIEDYEQDLEFNLVKDGDDWVIADNGEFLVAFLDFVFEAAYEEGNKDDKYFLEDGMDFLGVRKIEKLASKTYDEYIDSNN